MNFLVILIISITIFGFGIYFISSLAREAEDLRKLTLSQIDEQISDMACEGSDRVCIIEERKKIRQGKYGIFGVKILNIPDSPTSSDDFIIFANPSTPLGYKGDAEITSPALIINPGSRPVTIKKYDEKKIGIAVQVPKDAPVGGTYIIDVEIKNSGKNYVPLQKLYVEVY